MNKSVNIERNQAFKVEKWIEKCPLSLKEISNINRCLAGGDNAFLLAKYHMFLLVVAVVFEY